ncbi:hypothetical protein NW753_008062 [Fusarium oxysporum]|nr:hypothetical protein NW753_008062 [Fusarium oxysporum]KAJ4049645.1 hypothetical protein NW763_008943 [Fusarium oxysporum]
MGIVLWWGLLCQSTARRRNGVPENHIRKLKAMLELQEIQNEAETTPEDTDRLLYFHYSGHGTLRRHISNFDDDDGMEDDDIDDFKSTPLVIRDDASGGAYLTGRKLGLSIKRMVKNSHFWATVVLYSCFSGDGLRDDEDTSFTARWFDEIDDLVLNVGQDAEAEMNHEEEEEDDNDDEGSRDALGVRTCWLSDPDDCAVITACSRSQTAGEKVFEKDKQGVLIY